MRFALIALLAVLPSTASASVPRHDLVPPRVCLAGNWGTGTPEWRVQVGVFRDRGRARAMEARLAGRGLVAQSYIATWFDIENEPLAVVSRAYPSRAAAELAAARYRRVAGDAVVRRFVVWSR